MKILDATPVFFNTGLKYLALLSAGADLTISAHPALPKDDNALEFFKSCKIKTLDAENSEESFDCICDCAGMHKDIPTKFGVVELTGSGAHAYRNWNKPVFLADAGKVKVLETGLGTGNGLLRALLQLEIGSPDGKNVLIFGGGKVGSGVALSLHGAGANCIVVDKPECVRCRSKKITVIDLQDSSSIKAAISDAWAVVTATGIKNAVSAWSRELLNSSALLINIGVEDEFGKDVPEEKVLNKKIPLNFILDEPTLLRYIDPTMALSNLGVIELVEGHCSDGLNNPPDELEKYLLELVSCGAAAQDIRKLEEFYYD